MAFRPVGSFGGRILRSIRMFFTIWNRIKKGSVLLLEPFGPLPDRLPARSFLSNLGRTSSPPPTLTELTESLRKAAHDPRVESVYIRLTQPLTCGYAKLEELRRHLDYVRASGKLVRVYMESGSEKEYFLTLSADRVFLAPESGLSIRGFRVGASFVRGVLDKVGIKAEVQRFGKYKSAGDQLGRYDMSEAQREVLNSLLELRYGSWVEAVAEVTGKSQTEVEAWIEEAPLQSEAFAIPGWVSAIAYEGEILRNPKLDVTEPRTNAQSDEEKEKQRREEDKFKFRAVRTNQYCRVKDSTLGIAGKPVVAIIRANGAINTGKSTSSSLGCDTLIEQVRQAGKRKDVKAIILRIDSPGGSALASDLMWGELRAVREKKPIIASMVDVAASGGYYIAMACNRIVCERSTITGSVGVVTAKLSLGELYQRVGLQREDISKGAYAELDTEYRALNEDEGRYFERGALQAYKRFVAKAASSRGLAEEDMERMAQGRVWAGSQALTNGLADVEGGFWKAVEIAKQESGIAEDQRVRLVEFRSFLPPSPLSVLRGSASSSSATTLLASLASLAKPEILAMSDVDASLGGEPSPVDSYLLSKLRTGDGAEGILRVFSELMSRAFQ